MTAMSAVAGRPDATRDSRTASTSSSCPIMAWRALTIRAVIVVDDYISADDVVISDINPTLGLFPKPGKDASCLPQHWSRPIPHLRCITATQHRSSWHFRDHLRVPPILGCGRRRMAGAAADHLDGIEAGQIMGSGASMATIRN